MTSQRVRQDKDWLAFEERLFGALHNSWSELFEAPPPTDWSSVTIRQLSGQGATSRQFVILIPSTIDGGRKLFVKQYVSREDDRDFWGNQLRREFSVTKVLSQKLEACPWFKVIKPGYVISDDLVLVTDFVEGQNLGQFFFKTLRFSRLFSSSFYQLQNLVQIIGHGLRELQLLDLDELSLILGRPNSSGYLENLMRLLEDSAKYLEALGYFPDLVRWGRRTLDRVLACSDLGHSMCFQHTDFILHNFIVDCQGQLTVFDFPNATIGVPYFDASHFVSSLEDLSYPRTVSDKHVESLVRSFLLALGAQERLNPVIFDSFRVLFHFLSTVIILKGRHSRRSGLRWLLFEDTLSRFKRKVPKLLKGIDAGSGDLT